MALHNADTQPRVRILAPVDLPDPHRQLIQDVRIGLANAPRSLPPKYLYDAKGSRLYEEITRLPEYYPFRAEQGILGTAARQIVETGCPEVVVEFGSGSASKTRVLLDALTERGLLSGYGAIEVSESALRSSLEGLAFEYSDVEFEGVLADFNLSLPLPFEGSRRLLLFLGSTIGNLKHEASVGFLSRVASAMSPGDTLLVGFDLVKDPAVIEAAYSDLAGVTAEFNLNLLHRLNRELGSDFRTDRYEHSAPFVSDLSQIEMHLVAREDQHVSMGVAGFSFDLRAGESIRTEISRKFRAPQIEDMARASGLERIGWYTDPDGFFGVGQFRRIAQ